MAIEFKKEIGVARFIHPVSGEEESRVIETRVDPLTGHTSLVIPSRLRKFPKPDMSGIIEQSAQQCPFCPVSIEIATPRFLPELFPEGHVKVGEATIIPNLGPYTAYSALVILSPQHFLGFRDFTEDMLEDGFRAALIYLRRVKEVDPEAVHCTVSWNYMPPAGSSQVHSHLQVLAGRSPLAYQRELNQLSAGYHARTGGNYWSDLSKEEKKRAERYIGDIGKTAWFAPYACWSWQMDVLTLFPEKPTALDLFDEDVRDYARGLKNVFRYMHDQDFYAFNLCIYSGIPDSDHFWTHARIIQRGQLPPLAAGDAGALRLMQLTSVNLQPPEQICAELKSYFAAAEPGMC